LPKKSITRTDLYDAVYQKVGLSRTETAHLVELVIETISDAIVAGESVKLSSFGTFMVREKLARIGRNPKTGEESPIPPRKVILFKASDILKQNILAGNSENISSGEQN